VQAQQVSYLGLLDLVILIDINIIRLVKLTGYYHLGIMKSMRLFKVVDELEVFHNIFCCLFAAACVLCECSRWPLKLKPMAMLVQQKTVVCVGVQVHRLLT
jgi:hypothetical protein